MKWVWRKKEIENEALRETTVHSQHSLRIETGRKTDIRKTRSLE